MKYALLLLVILCSCSATKNSSTQNSTSITATDRIAFVTFKITKGDSLYASQLTIVKTSTVDGSFKQPKTATEHSSNTLKFEVYQHQQLGSITIIEHPLYKDIEYLDSSNVFSMKHLELSDTQFFVRLQLKGPSNKIRIIESLQGHHDTELTIIDL